MNSRSLFSVHYWYVFIRQIPKIFWVNVHNLLTPVILRNEKEKVQQVTTFIHTEIVDGIGIQKVTENNMY